MNIVYKVVGRTPEGNLVSCSIWNIKYRLTYTPGEWVKPVIPDSKIFCYSYIKDAAYFVNNDLFEIPPEVWEAEAEDVVQLTWRCSKPNNNEILELYWKTIQSSNKLTDPNILPALEYSCGCSKIKLLRKVYEGDGTSTL